MCSEHLQSLPCLYIIKTSSFSDHLFYCGCVVSCHLKIDVTDISKYYPAIANHFWSFLWPCSEESGIDNIDISAKSRLSCINEIYQLYLHGNVIMVFWNIVYHKCHSVLYIPRKMNIFHFKVITFKRVLIKLFVIS